MARQFDVASRGGRIAAGMVVDEDQAVGPVAHGGIEDFARMGNTATEAVDVWTAYLDSGEFHYGAPMVRPLYEEAKRKGGG